jgi:hypothetical protein
MDAKRLMAALIVGIMIVSGLGIVSVGAASDEIIIEPEATPPIEKNTVPRVVLFEDFTSWECPPCSSFSPVFSAVIDANGYSKVAPAMYHVWWPNYDDDPIYQYNKVEVTNRVNYYGCNYVPWLVVDGTQQATSTTQSVLQGYLNNRLAVPANISMDTQGWISGGVGEIGVTITAVENIAATDLYMRAMLWETDITRPLWNYRLGVYDSPPYPNGETVLDWGVWDYVPDDKGTRIWPNGATAGDKVDIVLPFDISDVDGLVESKVGVTVFVQSQSTKYVEQAAVDTFDNFPPTATMTSPAPATAEQILSGTIPIIWTATDVEDSQASLDISIDYSADGGHTWTNIMSGTDNNVAPYTYNWNTVSAGIPDGPGYKVRVKATDSQGDWGRPQSIQAFSIDNTANDRWYLQVETSGANMDLDMRPVENTPNSVTTPRITAAGQYFLGKWDTALTFTDKNINGEWTFNVYGKTPDPGYVPLVAYMYAKVFTSSNPATPLDTTILDNENVGAFKTSHLFSWTDTLSGTIVNGDNLLIEIWVSAVGGPYPDHAFMSPNAGFNTSAAPWYFTAVTSNTDGYGTAAGNYVATNGNPGGYVNVVLTPPGSGVATRVIRSGYWEVPITIGCVPTNPVLNLDWKCFSVGTDKEFTYAYAFVSKEKGVPAGGTPDLIAASVWNQPITATTNWASITQIDLSGIVTEDTTYYLKLMFRTALQRGTGTYNLGFDNAKITWTQASPLVYAEFDYGLTQSNVAPYIGSGGGPAPATYNIPLTGKTANSWVFVSFPIDVSGTINTILNDATLGDGGTTWTIAKWYNPQTPADPWKTYRVGGTANDLATVNNQMGVWLWITANGGNQMLTTGVTGLYPTSSVNIELKAGWNLVGYPSATSRLASATLPGVADRVSVWNAASPYVTDYSDKSLVTMSQGNAYWVRVTSDVTWTVGI